MAFLSAMIEGFASKLLKQIFNRMPNLSSILSCLENDEAKLDFMFNLFESLKKQVNSLLVFGPCNNNAANQVSNVYYHRKRNQRNLFSCSYTKTELKFLPTVIANSIRINESLKQDSTPCSSFARYQNYLKMAYIYGTGTCELFAIVGAYYLAKEYEVELSIETIYSEESHTYIRVHTNPEYIIDFWDPMLCEYKDDMTWNEFFGTRYIRNHQSRIKNEIFLNEEQIRAMSEPVFTHVNELRREQTIATVLDLVKKESLSSSANDTSVVSAAASQAIKTQA